jgi:hypothetical protein
VGSRSALDVVKTRKFFGPVGYTDPDSSTAHHVAQSLQRVSISVSPHEIACERN